MEPGRQSLSSYHGNRINETGDGGTYADSRESDFSISAVHRLLLEKRTPGRIAVVWPIVRGGPPATAVRFGIRPAPSAGRHLTGQKGFQDGPYDGPEWGMCKYQ
jgi:hypothetical protein